MLKVFEAFTRAALSVAVPAKMSGNDVLEALHPLILERGGPVYIRSDNGPECVAAPLSAWLIKVGI
jgi:transposase InsO family protein